MPVVCCLILLLLSPGLQDRVRLENGEVLKGKLLTMQEGKLEFESESAGKLVLDWGSIRSLVTDGVHKLVLEDGTEIERKLEDGMSLSDIRALDPSPLPSQTTGSIKFGLAASFGNTDRSSASLSSEISHRIDKDRIKGSFDWFYAEEKDAVTRRSNITQRRVLGSAQYDRFVAERSFLYAHTQALGDHGQSLELRFIAGAGYGYQFLDSEDTSLAVEVGLAHTYEDFEARRPEQHLSLRLAVVGSHEIFEDMKFLANLQWLSSLEDQDDQLVNGAAELRASFGKGFIGSLRYEFDFDNSPSSGRDRVDQRLLFTLGYSF